VTARRGVGLTPMETRREVIVKAAVLADELGYESFAVPEGWGLDSTPVLAEIALRTARIRLASGILSVWGRTPATLAMAAATLNEISGGRYVLGLGTSTRALAEGLHDTPFEHPADKLRDVVTQVRALLAGEPAPLRHVAGARPLRLGRPPAPEVPIWVAALGDHTTRVAAELGDGWIPALVARDRVASWGDRLRKSSVPRAGAVHRSDGAHHRRRREPRHRTRHRRHVYRLVFECHGRRLRSVRLQPGLCQAGQRDRRREPAAESATRDRPARRPARTRSARRVRNP
jgi:alkanesulfonate monooxygenase SsuD/methylene tetrahydromethanopterin reductase-like flavin-dependent oxidoreductase (luciferase family)